MTSNKPNMYPEIVNLGLSQHQAMIYQLLITQGALSAKEIAKQINILPNAVYRLARDLKKKRFITISETHPAIFSAVSPTLALESYTSKRIAELHNQKNKLISELSKMQKAQDQTQVNFINSRQEIFFKSLNSVKKAKKEILIISIGEQIPEEVVLGIKRSIDRGVTVNMIAHKYNDENKSLLQSWLKMGWKVKHYPDWGFHLVIVDGKESILSVNDPKNTSQRVGLQFFSLGLSKALQDYFYSTWKKAISI